MFNETPKQSYNPIIRKDVRIVEIPEGATPIDITILKDIVLECFEVLKKDPNFSISSESFKTGIYSIVKESLRKKNFFFPKLNGKIIFDILSGYTENIVSEIKSNDEEEYDHLCWLKIHGKNYNTSRFNDLSKRFG